MTLSVTLVIWLTQVLQRVELMVEDGGSLLSFAKVTVLLIPSLVVIILPLMVLATCLSLLNRLHTDSEIAVMTMAGTSRLRIARPFLLLGLCAASFTYYLNADLLPRSYRALKLETFNVRTDIAKNLIVSGQFNKVDTGLMIYAEEVNPGGQYLGVMIYDTRFETGPITYMAEAGLFRVADDGRPKLHLARGNIQRIIPGTRDISIGKFTETTLDLQPYQGLGNTLFLEETERYISELLNPETVQPHDPRLDGKFIANGHARLATPLYIFVYILASCCAMLLGPINRNGYGKRIAICVSAVLVLRIIGIVVQTNAEDAPELNVVQYLLPGLACLIMIGFLVGNPRIGLGKERRARLQNHSLISEEAAT